MRFDAITFIEQAYTDHTSNEVWLKGLVSAASALDQGFGVGALLADASRPDALAIIDSACPDQRWIEIGLKDVRGAPPSFIEATYTFGADLLSRRQRGISFHLDGYAEAVGLAQNYDALGVIGTDPCRVGCVVFAPVPGTFRPAPRTLHVLRKVAAHLASAGRLRRAPGAAGIPGPAHEAVLSPDGRMLDGNTRSSSLREEFRSQALAMDRARGQLRRTNPDDALGLWTGLVAGEWSLVEHEDRDGKRYLLAKRNPPNVATHLALSAIEATVGNYAALDHSMKFIGYELGLSVATVSAHLRSVLAKLQIRNRAELIRLFAHSGVGGSNAALARTRSG
jgi:DNA-binding CsgD family transcriptional regulator